MVEFWILKGGSIIEEVAIGSTIPVFTSAKVVSFADGAAFTYQITALNTPTAFYASALPFGLSIDNTTGLITGTLHANSIGEYRLTLQAANDLGMATMVLTVLIS